MPANLTPDYFNAEKKYREATTSQEKIESLYEMLAVMPKHKGTEHLQGDIKRRIAKLQAESHKKPIKSRSAQWDHIRKEGSGQIVLIGPPNSGKSSIVQTLTHAHTAVAEYPFSTFKPAVGMMHYEDIQIQLIDMPPISREFTEGWMYNIIRLADLILLILDISDLDVESKYLDVIDLLQGHKIILKHEGEKIIQSSGYEKSTLIVGTKSDSVKDNLKAEWFYQTYQRQYPIIYISIFNQQNLQNLKRKIFDHLKIIRVYTKIPGHKPEIKKPYILPEKSTVLQAADAIHKELAQTMQYARLWNKKKYNGQRIEKEHLLEDGDIIEIYSK